MTHSTSPISIEAPSGKDADYENFPVGSRLLPARLRPHIAVFYAFARAIDDIADSPVLASEDKIARLEGFGVALNGRNTDPAFAKGHAMADSLAKTKVTPRHCHDLIAAFKQDAVKGRYRDWDDLMAYCRLSAAPVGRYLLDLHGGSRDGYGPSDALCKALQVINHLQDCQDDYRTLDRVYLPGDWMAGEGAGVEDLDREHCTAGLRRVIDKALDATESLMAEAKTLPKGLRSRRLAMESGVIVAVAGALIGKLRRRDPLAGRVALSKLELAGCVLRGILSSWMA